MTIATGGRMISDGANTSARRPLNRYPPDHHPRHIQSHRTARIERLAGLWAEYTVAGSRRSADGDGDVGVGGSRGRSQKQTQRRSIKYHIGRIGRTRRGGKEEEWAVDEEVLRGWDKVGRFYVVPVRRPVGVGRRGEVEVKAEGLDQRHGLDGWFRLIVQRLRKVEVDDRLIRPFLPPGPQPPLTDFHPEPEPDLPPRYTTLSVPLPSFLIARVSLTKLQDPHSYLRWTKVISHLIDLGAWDSSEQAEIWAALVRGSVRWGNDVGLRVMGERFREVVVRTRLGEGQGQAQDEVERDQGRRQADETGGSVFGVKRVGRLEGFAPMGLTLTTILVAASPTSLSHDTSPNDAQTRTGRLKTVARRLMGRLTRRMIELNSIEWNPAWVGLLGDPCVMGSDARVIIARWVTRQRRWGQEGRVGAQVDLRRFTLIKTEVDRWVANDVKAKLFRPNPVVLPGETVERLMFRNHADLVKMDRGELPLSVSDALFKSALRDGENRRARRTLLKSNTVAVRQAGSRDRIDSLARAMAMADLSGNTKIMRQAVDTIEDVAQSDAKITTRDPHYLDWMRRLAWTRLLAGYHAQAGVSNRDWLELCTRLPMSVRADPGVLTTLMKCHMARQMPDLAWQCWQDLVEMKRIDAVAITLAATFKCDEAGIEAAMSFVDQWTGPSVDGQGGAKAPIDVTTVNVLLRLAGNARRADLATWLWQNMYTRWRVQPNATSLAYLIDCISRTESQIERSHIQANWAQHPTRTMPTSSRQTTSHSFKVETILRWQDVAEVFRNTAMTLYPDLAHVTSPMEEGRVMGAFKELVASGHLPQAESPRTPVPIPLAQSFPREQLHSDISLSALNFGTYIRMLLHRQLYDDAVLAIGWMKRLSIYPSRNTLLVVLRELADNGHPKDLRFLKEKTGWRRCQLMAPDEWLRHWLEMWLGPKRTPTDDDVAQSVRQRLPDPWSLGD